MIARSAATEARYGRHAAAREALYDSDLIMGREWLTIGNRRGTHTHQVLEDVLFGPRAMFNPDEDDQETAFSASPDGAPRPRDRRSSIAFA